MEKEEQEGVAYKWCVFCFTEWTEPLPWDFITEWSYGICTQCTEAGRSLDELTPEYWEQLMALIED